ncbi:MAG: starch-binding protein [Ruminococcus sp.]
MNMRRINRFLQENKKIAISVIALLEAVLIFSAATFSWIEGSKNGSVKDENSTVSAGTGLLFTDLNGNTINNLILDKVELEDCSSIDGRNFFFPTTETEVSASAQNMVFRAGTDNDKNAKYISKDFNIQAFTTADIYIDDTSTVTCDNAEILKALRISLNFNDGTNPVILCPGSEIGYPREYNPVKSISDTGTATYNGTTKAYSFANYSYNSGSITKISANETKRVTVSVWLEGSDDNCSSANVPTDSISINLILTTASNYTKQITFVDYSPNKWVQNKPDGATKDIVMFAIDKTTDIRYQLTRQSDNRTYTATLPDTVTDVKFARYDPNNPNLGYNYWAENTSMSNSDINTYYGMGRGKDVDGVNYGYWVKSSCTGVIDVELTEAALDNTLKFTNTNDWSTVNAYFFDDNEKTVGAEWPGTAMTWFETDSVSKTHGNYKITIPNGAKYVIFNDGNNQTVDIKLGSELGYYLTGGTEKNKNNKDVYQVGGWGISRSVDPNVQIFRYSSSNTSLNPNLYFQSATYGSDINLIGKFNPTAEFNKDSNFGLNMELIGTNSSGQYVYHMILPADSTIIFNGHDNVSSLITPSDIDKNKYQKIGYKFSDSTTYTTY